MLSFLPTAIFIIKIVKYTFYQSLSALFFYVVGLFLSLILFIVVLRYLYKND
ncbi:hypothetical protein HMPREF1345_02264 [Enterococcus faecium TX1337RF]|nr:hypothetical protein HMPREF1345_02264 [Enterococcus faecium TX1337RF]